MSFNNWMEGTPRYISLKILCKKEYDDNNIDAWSCGVAYPFKHWNKKFKKTIGQILGVQYTIPYMLLIFMNQL